MEAVCHEIPATTANLGPGYDCLGIALGLYNRVTLRRGRPGLSHPMVEATAAAFFRRSAVAPFDFEWDIAGEVPQARGLGSSVTVRLGILSGLNALGGQPVDRRELVELCVELEGHPDNALPAAYGGFVAGESARRFVRFEVEAELHFVLLIPEMELSTEAARKVLPSSISHADAVRSCRQACLVTAAFAARDYACLRDGFQDWLHQPYRAQLMPFLDGVIAAGRKAGALGGYLSGSGSCICCVSLENPAAVAEAMAAALPSDVSGSTRLLQPDNSGIRQVPVNEF